MFYSEIRFPEDISYGAVGGPEFSTDIVIAKNGYEQRNVNWSVPLVKYNVSHGVKTAQQLSRLITFFRKVKGKAYGFRFKDWADYKCIGEKIGVGDGTNCTFQIIKSYDSEIRIITNPVQNTVQVFVNDKEYVDGYQIDYQVGLVEFENPPLKNTIISVTCDFDIPARFDTDVLEASIDSLGIYSWNNISIIEIRPPCN